MLFCRLIAFGVGSTAWANSVYGLAFWMISFANSSFNGWIFCWLWLVSCCRQIQLLCVNGLKINVHYMHIYLVLYVTFTYGHFYILNLLNEKRPRCSSGVRHFTKGVQNLKKQITIFFQWVHIYFAQFNDFIIDNEWLQ